MSTYYSHVHLVVDGLDECEESTAELLDVLMNPIHAEGSTDRLLVLSRDEEHIRHYLSRYSKISVAAMNTNLQLYVHAKFERRIRRGQLDIEDHDFKAEMIHRLIGKAEGMFRWVACQIELICELPTQAALRTALDNLPPTLFATYERILEKISAQGPDVQKLVRRTLKSIYWAVPVRREANCEPEADLDEDIPISFTAVREMLAIDDGRGELLQAAVPTELQVLRCCRSLVRKSKNSNPLEYPHFTVKEYLTSIDVERRPDLGAFRLSDSVQDMHMELCKLSLQYLLFTNFDDELSASLPANLLKEDVERDARSHVNLQQLAMKDRYAFRYVAVSAIWHRDMNSSWHEEYDDQPVIHDSKIPRLALIMVNQEIEALTKRLLTGPTFASWARYSRLIHGAYPASTSKSDEPQPLHYAAMLQSPVLCRYLTERGFDVNLKSECGTPLACAALGCRALRGPIGHDVCGGFWLEHSEQERRVETLETLIDLGAAFQKVRGYDGLSTLDFLLELNDWWGVMALFKRGVNFSRKQFIYLLGFDDAFRAGLTPREYCAGFRALIKALRTPFIKRELGAL